ncbi:hypothetical protein ACFXGA_09890 [Actinosynnema sp. NPDC059335]|uniref:hypothetical protein n=1 Tax=Actinosynnema sp. NPDC059335 TaxID=3346804 RepID=UPI00366FB16A
MSELAAQLPGLAGLGPSNAPAVLEHLGVPPGLARQLRDGLYRLLEEDPGLSRAAGDLFDQMKWTKSQLSDWRELQGHLERSLADHPDVHDEMRARLVTAHVDAVRERDRLGAERGWVRRSLARMGRYASYGVILLVTLVAAVAPVGAVVTFADEGVRWALLRVFAVLALSVFPAFLLIRFVSARAVSIWEDFVLNLHRLGMDRPRHLPEPIPNSIYFERWLADGGQVYLGQSTIYERKFIAAFGQLPRGDGLRRMLRPVEISPVYLTTLLWAVCWTTVLWGAAPFDLELEHLSTMAALSFAFLGAYVFALQMLIRRYFQNDLRPMAYTSLSARTLFALVVGYTVHQFGGQTWSAGTEAAIMFVMGFFPVSALQLLRLAAGKALRRVNVPDLTGRYPLGELDGMNIWYEARLLEAAGIEDMQNLATANLTDLMLSTKVPTARLVDWVDQAILCLHLEPLEDQLAHVGAGYPRSGDRGAQARTVRAKLRAHGIRAATDVYDVRRKRPVVENLSGLIRCDGDDVSVMDSLAATLVREPNLHHVQCWQSAWQGS